MLAPRFRADAVLSTRPWLLGTAIDPFQARIGWLCASLHELLTGGLEPLAVLLPETVQHILTIEEVLRLDVLPVKDLLDHLNGRAAETARPGR